MPAVLEKFQKWQESRWNITVNAVKKYAALESETFPTSIETYVNDLKESASKASIEEDFKQFVDANKKDQTVALFSFVKFVGKYINTEEKKEQQTPVKSSTQVSTEYSFSTLTAEEKLEQEKLQATKKEEPKKEEAKKEEDPQKKEELKKKLFSEENIFEK